MNITVGKVKISELPEVKALLSFTWRDTYTFLKPETIDTFTTRWHTLEILQNAAENPNAVFAVARLDYGKIIGLTTAFISSEQDTIFMPRLYVHPKYQKLGIGTKLLTFALASFPNAKKMQLEVEPQNKKGISFYENHGFRKIGEKEEAIGDETIRALLMEKVLK